MSQAALAAREGLSQGHLSRRLARARRHRAREAEAHRVEQEHDRGDLDRFDYPLMVLGGPAEAGSRPHCTPEGATSQDRGTYHVGGQVRSLRGGVITTEDSTRTDGTAQPTSYEPDPDLKGGIG